MNTTAPLTSAVDVTSTSTNASPIHASMEQGAPTHATRPGQTNPLSPTTFRVPVPRAMPTAFAPTLPSRSLLTSAVWPLVVSAISTWMSAPAILAKMVLLAAILLRRIRLCYLHQVCHLATQPRAAKIFKQMASILPVELST